MVQLTGNNLISTAVFISGNGKNLKSLINFAKKKLSPIKIVLVVSSDKKAQGLNYAKINNIKTQSIFNWIKNQGVENYEMLKTFNCGVGFCLIINYKNLNRVKKFFSKEYQPYIIGKIISEKKKIKIDGKIHWQK